jgi:hypothetical protein
MYWLIGYNLMYPLGDWAIEGYFSGLFPSWGVLEPVYLNDMGLEAADDAGYASTGSDFFFQLMFCAATASIVSGTLAERIKLWPFLIFVVVLTGFIYPLTASWQWGGGWLSERASPTSQARPLCTRVALPQRSPVPSFSVRVWASTRTARSTRCRVPTSPSPRWACSSCGSAGSASTAVRSWPWARR